MAIGSVWDPDSWDEDAWGDVWGEGGTTRVFETIKPNSPVREVFSESVVRELKPQTPVRNLTP